MIAVIREIIGSYFLQWAWAILPMREREELTAAIHPVIRTWKLRSFHALPKHLQEKIRREEWQHEHN